MKPRNPNRPIVLSLADAAAIHRYLELVIYDRRFFNPLEAMENKQAMLDAKARLEAKLIGIVNAHRERLEYVG